MRRLRRAAVALLIGALILPSAPAAAYHRQRQAELELLIEQNRERIEQAKRNERSLLGQINDSDRRRELLQTQVRAADAELARAEAELARIAKRLSKLDAQVVAATGQLERSLIELYDHEVAMHDRVVAYYINGPTALDVATGSIELGDMLDMRGYAQTLFEADARLADELDAKKVEVEERRGEIQQHQVAVTREHAAQEAETTRLANARNARASAVSAVAGEIQLKEDLLGRVRSRRAQWERIVTSYERESARIEAFLRSSGSSSSGGAVRGQGGYFVWPVSGQITSPYGWRTHPVYGGRSFHTGIDIGVGHGTPIDAARSGRVVDAGYMGAYGLAAIIDHGEGMATLYAHMSSIRVSVGQQVRTGDVVGLVGSTGYSTGPHLHFEVRVNGSHQNPMNWL